MYCIVNNVFLTAQKHFGYDCQVQGDFASDTAAYTSTLSDVQRLFQALQKYPKNFAFQLFIILQ